MIDDTLYDAFGQRQVSTIFTQLNQYRVVLEVDPSFQQGPEALAAHLRALGERRPRCRSASFTHVEHGDDAPLAVNHQGSSRRSRSRSTSRRASSLGEAVDAIDAAADELGLPPSIRGELPGHGAGVPGVARERAVPDPGGARHRLHRARRALRELHPPAHDPLDAAVGRRRRAPRAAALPAATSASSRSSASSC